MSKDSNSSFSLQQQKLFQLAKSKKISSVELQHTIEQLCEGIAEMIQCERIGVWLFDDEQPSLTALNVYQQHNGMHTSGERLHKHQFPAYFTLLKGTRVIAISDVSNDERVKELYPDYFSKAGNIQSMIDAPIVLANGVAGVVCCESSIARSWTRLEESLAGTFSDLVGFLLDSLQQQEMEKKLEYLAYYDQLTGLPNLNLFYSEVNGSIHRAENPVLCYLQVDQVDQIIDALGYDGGDQIIKEIAGRFNRVLKSNETVARADHDHFALFLDEADVENRLKNILFLMSPPFLVTGYDVTATFSAGVSRHFHGENPAKELLQSAQIALNRGKMRSARSSVTWFTEEMKESSKDHFAIEMDLRKGLDLNQFILYFQPQVEGEEGEITGFESLIRWNHPEIGLVPPGVFIPLAESTGFIIPLGEWVIKESIKELKKFHDNGMDQVTMSINISPRQFLHQRLPAIINEGLLQYHIPPERLCLEITESVAMEEEDLVIERLKLFDDMGIQLSVDDFGTGFSAFVYLQEYPIKEIKIDKEFIRRLTTNHKSMAIVKTIIDLAENLDISVIAEGLETIEQWALLNELGCKRFQGYLLSRPLPPDEINGWIDNYKRASFYSITRRK
ncbi:sensor domain-containing phosphodiesterase [Jeotgalibacillus aurantiacus]|uniref:sensor domain-containing phosphodiesterase n=1 Tax=Jeotgalibacillus aurantiacus TaxID=2763266 RepID=UPI001D0A9B96|nr:EAL domain-containing protein [Jeotgalibacillus aurantiacus]